MEIDIPEGARRQTQTGWKALGRNGTFRKGGKSPPISGSGEAEDRSFEAVIPKYGKN